MDSLEILLEIGNISLTPLEKIRYAGEKNNRYLDYIQHMTSNDILPGVKKFLSKVKSKKILLGLGSASKNAKLILEKIKITSMFDVIVDGNLITQAKPHPEIFARGAALLNTDPVNCIVFEDAVAGIQAAHNAGMKCIGVGSSDILKEADLVIPGFMNLKLEDITLD